MGDPTLGFGALEKFGPSLKVSLKVRTGLQTPGLMLVDSPGMIDSPGAMRASPLSDATPTRVGADWRLAERGYDFLGVTEWLAERADVILVCTRRERRARLRRGP
eukprot:978801-Prymnesium_polylepis.1